MAKTQKQLVEDIEKNIKELDDKLGLHLKYEFEPTIKTIKDDIEELKKREDDYVRNKEFKPFADGIIWFIRAVLLIVLSAVLAIAFGKATK